MDSLLAQWDARVIAANDRLKSHEDDVQAEAEAEFEKLAADVERYGAVTGEAAEQMLEEEARSVMNTRRNAALALLDTSDAYLKDQASSWRDATERLCRFFIVIATAFDAHKASVIQIDDGCMDSLRGRREQYDNDCNSNEQSLSDAIQRLKLGANEKQLDSLTQACLERLDVIEENYRNFHGDMVKRTRQHPVEMGDELDRYQNEICEEMAI